MESKNLNDVSIYIVPLIDDNITLRDLSPESGFINAYTSDINRPYLEDKVFLLYDSEVNTKESLERYLKFRALDTIYNIRYITINKHHYIVYCFNNPTYRKDISNLRLNGKTYSAKAKAEIVNFWNNVPVPELTLRLFIEHYRFGDCISAQLPEEDYYPYEESPVD